jgi:hypothetical protein
MREGRRSEREKSQPKRFAEPTPRELSQKKVRLLIRIKYSLEDGTHDDAMRLLFSPHKLFGFRSRFWSAKHFLREIFIARLFSRRNRSRVRVRKCSLINALTSRSRSNRFLFFSLFN